MENRYKNKAKLTLALVALLTFGNLLARNANNINGNKGGGSTPTPTAGCSPAVALASLEFNNVRARIDATGGSMFQDRGNGIAAYNVPKQNSQTDPLYTAIYAGGLWIGGVDQGSNTLKVAAVTFRSGGKNDFWPGPLTDGSAEVTSSTCSVFDQFFGVSRPMVNELVSWQNDPASFPNYQIPAAILNWPAKGNTVRKKQESYYVGEELAPFYDYNGDTYYDPNDGDYPKYDLIGANDCRTNREVPLFGDTTIWFVFNDKGNSHTEFNGAPIGMEVRGQAFAFATNDEINNMTFYNYVLVNRSSFTFTNTYFGQWIDADLGNSNDDFVGCDASRGLGYAYNGDNNDEDANGVNGYGATPPFIGVDFFEGPYMNDDGIDNPLTEIVQNAIDSNGIPYAGLGIGYGDGIIDNERYGMRKFVYYNIGSVINGNGDPNTQADVYNYLQGKWLGTTGAMRWGGDGNPLSTGTGPVADLMFPGNSDPLNWSTKGIAPTPIIWSEVSEGNTPADRRFIQSAGPFTLFPGAVNNITVGVVYARALSGDNTSSLSYLQVADDKAQALFDSCFKILEGPNAPDVTIQELENELILFLSNNNPISNNYQENANLKDPFISIPDSINGVFQGTDDDRDTLKYYKFQGYQIYQVKTSSVSISALEDPSVSRLIAQVDIKDNISQIVNYVYDALMNANVPVEMVKGSNNGINHSFRVTDDQFSTSTNKKLVNHKTYHFVAIAYAYNNWQTVDPQYFAAGGQLKPYLASRTNSTGSAIRIYSGIPHSNKPENGGTVLNSSYGDSPEITRIEGAGNGGLSLELTSSSEAQIVSSNFMNYPVYQAGYGPIEVKVVDPLNVKKGTYFIQFLDSTAYPTSNPLNDAYWQIIVNGTDTIFSERNIAFKNEQVFSNLGFSVSINQTISVGSDIEGKMGLISATVSYSNPSKPWLAGLPDADAANDLNWIRSGNQSFNASGDPPSPYNDYQVNGDFIDPNQKLENMLKGTWSPYRLVSTAVTGQSASLSKIKTAPGILDGWNSATTERYYSTVNYAPAPLNVEISRLNRSQSVDIVFTNNQSKWTRCVVFETGWDRSKNEGNVRYFSKRAGSNVDKNGNPDGTLNPIGGSGVGMGWFPGYAINLETGERLNMAFGEDSKYINHNGRDMKWNPNSEIYRFDTLNMVLDTVMGSKHFTYVFNTRYDECRKLDSLLSFVRPSPAAGSVIAKTVQYISESAIWAGIPIVADGQSLLSNDARIKLRVTSPYISYLTSSSVNPFPVGNNSRPMYMFNMDNFAAETGVEYAAKEVLDMIKAVPNPYYAYSDYESNKFDNRIKITNLPEKCTISIYNVSGTLMRRFNKASSLTSLDWDLKNQVGIPVAGGVYLIHIDIPGVGETVIKWFGVTRPTDLNGL